MTVMIATLRVLNPTKLPQDQGGMLSASFRQRSSFAMCLLLGQLRPRLRLSDMVSRSGYDRTGLNHFALAAGRGRNSVLWMVSIPALSEMSKLE
jgi:hypothetical protein